MDSIAYISESKVLELLNFEAVYNAVESALESVAQKRAIQNDRGITVLPHSQNKMYTMPGYLQATEYSALGCKILTEFPKNTIQGFPTIMANVLLLDEQNGRFKAVVAGTELTLWRTAAASAVATKYLHGNKDKNVLAVVGAGAQGKIHARAFQHYFAFKEVRIWNRTTEKGRQLAKELNQEKNGIFVPYERIEDCVKDADVIVTATSTNKPLVEYRCLKKGVHINAVGVCANTFELDEATYKASDVYVDSWEGAKSELAALNVDFKGQIGDVIMGLIPAPDQQSTTVFQSLGMAVEDCAVARLVYDLYKKDSETNTKKL